MLARDQLPDVLDGAICALTKAGAAKSDVGGGMHNDTDESWYLTLNSSVPLIKRIVSVSIASVKIPLSTLS